MVDSQRVRHILNHMVDHSNALDQVFRALADPTRRAMLADLKQGPRSISTLAAPHAMTLAGAAKHVKVLELAGLVDREKSGREQICALKPEPLADAEQWLSTYAAFWSDRLDALERVLKDDERENPHA